MRIGVGVSTAPDARQAAVEAAAHARDELAGEASSLAVLLGSRSHTNRAVDVLDAVQQTLEPPALIGCVAQAIVAGRHEIEDEPAVAVWLASGLAAETLQLDFVRTGSGGLLTGYRFDPTAHDLHLLLPDPYTFPSSLLIEHLNTDLPGTTSVGGVVSGGRGPGDTRLFRDHGVLTSGLVGVRLPGLHGIPIVSQGCRPIGDPYIVTGADGALITELGGRPPLQRLREIVEGLPRDEQELVSHGLQIGIVVDEHRAAPGQGDFLIRGLLGADQSTGAIEIGDVVEVGATVQFQVRDAAGADKDLRLAVERAGAELPGRPVGALLFTCNGRGQRMFRVADHDASTIEDLLGGIPLAGFFAAGEIGPIAGRNALAFLAQDQPRAGRPVGQVHQVGDLGDPGAVADAAIGGDRRIPGIGVGEYLGGLAHPRIDDRAQGKPHSRFPAGRREPVGRARGIGADQHLWGVGVIRARAVGRRQRCQRLTQHGDVVGGGVTAGVARSQQPGQRFPGGDIGAIQKHQQRVMPERLLPGRGGVFLVVGMVDGDGGIYIQMQPPLAIGCRTGCPRLRPGMGSSGPNPRQMGGVDALIDQPPQRGSRADSTEGVLAIPPQPTDPVNTVRAVGHRGDQISEHRPGRMDPRPPL